MKFVRSNKSVDGIGKLVESDGSTSTIEYFDSPVSADRPRRNVPASSIESVRLEAQTRVYFFDRKRGSWRAGRIDNHLGGFCTIKLPNEERVNVAESEVYVRWNHPIEDPCEHLAARVAETPFFHVARAALLAAFVRQRAASAGMTGFLSAPVILARHQVEIVRRVLQDPVQRYLLADEVGLGKTIEAGIIIRQFTLDFPRNHRVLIIAPETLVAQWKSEIRERCQLTERGKQRVSIIALEALTRTPREDLIANMVVIDEAHQAVKGWEQSIDSPLGKRFELLRAISSPSVSPRLLLLSATPVRHNEDDFLALLHLLDPAVYSLADKKSFRDKVAKRQELADLFFAFTEDTLGFFLEDMLDQLAGMFPSDGRLQNLLANVRGYLDPAFPEDSLERRDSIRAVRTHLSETYRLHRRLLRTRRSEAMDTLLPGRAGVEFDRYQDDAAQRAEQALERWRGAAGAFVWGREESEEALAYGRCFALLLEAANTDLNALAWCIAERLCPGQNSTDRFGRLTAEERVIALRTPPLFPGETVALHEILDAVKSVTDANGARVQWLVAAVNALLAFGSRVIVFATSPALADQIFVALGRTKRTSVLRHHPGESIWESAYRATVGPVALVCDFRAEEGLNLQGGDACMIHADLPFSPNVLEQRIGRLDRFGADNKVQSLAPLPHDCPYQAAWAECLSSAFGVFSRSISALQYVVENEMLSLPRTLLTEGPAALQNMLTNLSGNNGLLQKELRAIKAQDELDSIEVLDRGDSLVDLTEAMKALDAQPNEIQACVDSWLSETLQLDRIDEGHPDNRLIRYHYRRIDEPRSTLIPKTEFAEWFGDAVDRDARIVNIRPPLTWALSFSRITAQKQQIGLGRIGNPVIDSLHRYLRWDDRGTCFAFWRVSPTRKAAETQLFFRFDFVVEASLLEANLLHAEFPELTADVLRRRADACFPPINRTIWISEFLEPVDEETVTQLEKPYVRSSFATSPHSASDTNINQDRWSRVRAHYDLTQWPERCRMARTAAGEALIRTVDLAQLTEKFATLLQTDTNLVREQSTSRIDALSPFPVEQAVAVNDLHREIRLREALLAGIRRPNLYLDAAGAVFLAGFPLV